MFIVPLIRFPFMPSLFGRETASIKEKEISTDGCNEFGSSDTHLPEHSLQHHP
jgi:hypothetical protein